jgi:hypothetical protein
MASTGTGGSATSGAGGSGGTSGTGGSVSEPTDSILYDFEAADAANGWEPLGGDWQVMADPDDASNSVYAQVDAGAGKVWLVGGDASWTNFEIEARVKLLEAGGYVFIGGRFESEDAYYYMYLRDNGKVRVRAFIGGSTSELGSAATDTFTDIEPGAWHTIKLSLQGSTLQAFFANVPAGAAVTHSALSAGGIVLGAQDAAVAFDDVTVTLY